MGETDYFVKLSTRLRRADAIRAMRGAPLTVWLAYSLYVGKDGTAWPSVETIAKLTGYCERQVQRITRKLLRMEAMFFIGYHFSGVRIYRLPDVVCFGSTEEPASVETQNVTRGATFSAFSETQNVTRRRTTEGELFKENS